jgi:hypothetical protein
LRTLWLRRKTCGDQGVSPGNWDTK